MTWPIKIATFFITAVFIFTTGGILLVQTFCACTNTEIATLYVTPEHCHHEISHSCHHNHASETAQKEAHCCSNAHENQHCSHEQFGQPECEKSEYTLIKISQNYLAQEEIELESKVFALPLFVLWSVLVDTDAPSSIETAHYSQHSPPIQNQSGRMFILSHQCLKLPRNA